MSYLIIFYVVFWTLQPVLVITDGKQTTNLGLYTPLEAISSRLQKKKASVFALGIGDNIDKSELEKIASSPDNVFTVKSFNDLESKVQQIRNGFCIGIAFFSRNKNNPSSHNITSVPALSYVQFLLKSYIKINLPLILPWWHPDNKLVFHMSWATHDFNPY